MWRNNYKDYKPDGEWVQDRVEPGKGIVGCEMHEINGWQELQHSPKKRKRGWTRLFLDSLFKHE